MLVSVRESCHSDPLYFVHMNAYNIHVVIYKCTNCEALGVSLAAHNPEVETCHGLAI